MFNCKLFVDFKIKHKIFSYINYLELEDDSKIVDLRVDQDNNIVDTIVVNDDIVLMDEYYLEIKNGNGSVFENGQVVSTDPTMRIIVPNEGDTFTLIISGRYNNCEDIKEYEVIIPPILQTNLENGDYDSFIVLPNPVKTTESSVIIYDFNINNKVTTTMMQMFRDRK